ncbi:MAG: hypothetical protein EXX96DRAFT_30963 [Benjaminiella poitrasii]|nr:MAG: hypothetical protein EXX96DRAFT_30963 [Benjaminiella poitrasii]
MICSSVHTAQTYVLIFIHTYIYIYIHRFSLCIAYCYCCCLMYVMFIFVLLQLTDLNNFLLMIALFTAYILLTLLYRYHSKMHSDAYENGPWFTHSNMGILLHLVAL